MGGDPCEWEPLGGQGIPWEGTLGAAPWEPFAKGSQGMAPGMEPMGVGTLGSPRDPMGGGARPPMGGEPLGAQGIPWEGNRREPKGIPWEGIPWEGPLGNPRGYHLLFGDHLPFG